MVFTEASQAKFTAEIQRFGSTLLPQQLVAFHQKVVLQVLRGVVFKTPVDTGRARGGWQTTVNFIPSEANGAIDKHGSATFDKGLTSINGLAPFSVVYVSNNVEYIVYLEEGTPKQPPIGMVSLTLEEVRQQFVGITS